MQCFKETLVVLVVKHHKYSINTLLITCSQTLVHYLVFPSVANECTWWRLFQEHVVDNKLDIYVFITRKIQLCLIDWFLMFWRHFQQYFSYIMATSFSGGGNRRTTDHGQATSKHYHLRLRVECTFFVIYKAGRKPTPYWW